MRRRILTAAAADRHRIITAVNVVSSSAPPPIVVLRGAAAGHNDRRRRQGRPAAAAIAGFFHTVFDADDSARQQQQQQEGWRNGPQRWQHGHQEPHVGHCDHHRRRRRHHHHHHHHAALSSGERSVMMMSSSSALPTTLQQPYSATIMTINHRHRHHHHHRHPQQLHHRHQQRAGFVSVAEYLPDVMTNMSSIWGGTGYMLKLLHADGDGLPYWACFSAISVLVRLALFPIVLNGAYTSVRFGRVVPDMQAALSILNNNRRRIVAAGLPRGEIWPVAKLTWLTIAQIYRKNNIKPYSIFLSPLLQLPVFLYISMDVRKIVNGRDPQLAQQLVDSPVAWIPDLTAPDPWFALPVLCGALLYANMEIAMGRANVAGQPAASQANFATTIKDSFQSIAIFMPCFTCQLQGGVQIYIATSFCYTLCQSALLRTDAFRLAVGLPPHQFKPPGHVVEKFTMMQKLEDEARAMRGGDDSVVLGRGVLHPTFSCSFPGTYRKSSIEGSGIAPTFAEYQQAKKAAAVAALASNARPSLMVQQQQADADPSSAQQQFQSPKEDFIHGISALPWQLAADAEEERRRKQQQQEPAVKAKGKSVVKAVGNSDEVTTTMIDDANRGEFPTAVTQIVDIDDGGAKKAPAVSKLRFNTKKGKRGKGKKRKGSRR